MNTHSTDMSEGGGTKPVACTLASAALAVQASRWEQLAAQAMVERTETGYGLRLAFRREPGVEEELRMLAAVENECCAWADWTVQVSATHVVLDVHSVGHGIATLHSMFTGLQPAQPCRRR